jgi:hypothetical protein
MHIALTKQAHDTESSMGENPAQLAKAAPAAGFLSAGFYPNAKRGPPSRVLESTNHQSNRICDAIPFGIKISLLSGISTT